MSEIAYQKLAKRLDAIPNGFPPTKSGIELKLLAKMFTLEEADLASVMRLTLEKAADIAIRLEMDPDQAYRALKTMVRKGLIRAGKDDGKLTFGLMPFAVGIYEEQLPRIDQELATLFEQYYLETQGGITKNQPALHRVIPVEEAIPFELEIFPYERASEIIERAKSWGVRNCICRVQQDLIGKGCDHPVENCLILAPVEGAFDHNEVTRGITKAQALDILQQAEDAGLVHSTGNYQDSRYYICNCCTCSCGILRGVAEFNIPTVVAHSDFLAVVDEEICAGCEDCLERCQFDALSVNGVCEVDESRCVGCGLCVTVCSTESLHLERRPEGETPLPPQNIQGWMVMRAEAREISIFDVL